MAQRLHRAAEFPETRENPEHRQRDQGAGDESQPDREAKPLAGAEAGPWEDLRDQ
jgi:hypothetical protein